MTKNKFIEIENKMTVEEKSAIIAQLKDSYKYYNFLQRMIKKIKGEVPNWKNIENYTDEQLKYLVAARKCETYIQFLHRKLGYRNMEWYFSLLENEKNLNFAIAEEEKISVEFKRR